jgi:hypothetical protein
MTPQHAITIRKTFPGTPIDLQHLVHPILSAKVTGRYGDAPPLDGARIGPLTALDGHGVPYRVTSAIVTEVRGDGTYTAVVDGVFEREVLT